MNVLPCQKSRIYYLDYIKALTIVGVVYVHAHIPPSWITVLLVNAVFFFLAGLFFKKPNRDRLMSDYRKMLAKDCKTLLLPFLFFYVLSYPFRIVVYLWDNRTLAGFDWWCFFDLFDICGRSDYLFVNVPLWFILCLFVIKSIYYFVRCLPEFCILVIAVAALCMRDALGCIPTPFMINNACYWMGFFVFGNLFACHVAPQKMSILCRVVMSCAAIVVLVLSLFLEEFVSVMVLQYVRVFAALMMLLFGISLLENFGELRFLSFIGRNTLTILGCHIWFLIPLGRVSYKITGEQTVWTGAVQTIICMIFCCLFILISNKYFPALVGKSSTTSR